MGSRLIRETGFQASHRHLDSYFSVNFYSVIALAAGALTVGILTRLSDVSSDILTFRELDFDHLTIVRIEPASLALPRLSCRKRKIECWHQKGYDTMAL